jgi:hypothetical protein
MNQTLTRIAAAVVAVCLLVPSAQAQDITFTLNNYSGLDLIEFYAAPASDEDWGDDLLGADILPDGNTGVVLIADESEECIYDLYFVMSDGGEYEDQVDICELRSYTLE